MHYRLSRATACFLICPGLAACAPAQRFTYQGAKQEFAGPAAASTPAAPTAAAQPDLSQPLNLTAAIRLALAQNPD